MSSLRIALGLSAGLVCGVLLHWLPASLAGWIWTLLEPVGTLWLNALRMTVLPLVVALLVAGIGRSTETAGASRLALRALRVFILLLATGATYLVGTLLGTQIS
jgi:Na+/H+-dicarboxylate symporter